MLLLCLQIIDWYTFSINVVNFEVIIKIKKDYKNVIDFILKILLH